MKEDNRLQLDKLVRSHDGYKDSLRLPEIRFNKLIPKLTKTRKTKPKNPTPKKNNIFKMWLNYRIHCQGKFSGQKLHLCLCNRDICISRTHKRCQQL